MKKYFNPELNIREFNLENIVTESGVAKLQLDKNVGSLDGSIGEDVGDVIFF